MLGSGGGELGSRNSFAARESTAAADRESGSVGHAVCVVFSPHLDRCCYFSLCFAVLLNCPYPHPPVSACFFPFSYTPRRGEGQSCGAFVAGHSQTITASRDGDSITSLGSLFQGLTTSVKKLFLISNLNLPWHKLRPLPLILSLVT